MDNNTIRSSVTEDDQVIDLKELVLFICRKWRVLIALGIVGLVLGAGFGLLKPEPSIDDLELSELNLREIEQYARYQQLYDEQAAYEKESVYLNIDPYEAYTGSVRYYLRIKESNSAIAASLYAAILGSNSVYSEMIEASGLNCTLRAIQELAEITYDELDRQEQLLLSGDAADNQVLTVQVEVSVTAPSADACQSMLELLDGHVQDVTQYVEKAYGAVLEERIADECEQASYHAGIIYARNLSTKQLAEYANQLTTLKKTLTEDDLLYYSETYPVDEPDEERGMAWLKWALIIGVLLGALGVCGYGVVFVLDDHVKTMDELLAYGLHPFAVIEEQGAGRKLNAIDRLFTAKHGYNPKKYLVEALEALDVQSILLCGDMDDADVAATAQQAAGLSGKLSAGMRMDVDADTQRQAKHADGVVLIVHLWRTRRAELEQEIRICQKLGIRVLGVAVIG